LHKNLYVVHVFNSGTREEGKGKQNDQETTILKYITSVHVEDIMICTESCSIMGGKGGSRVKREK
jgi:hypothetical protein